MNKYIIIPGCSDLNRGDQALGWETKRIANDCNFVGDFYLLAEKWEPTIQSEKEGFKILRPILQHPSKKVAGGENINYTLGLKIRLGVVALFDLIWSSLLITPLIGKFILFFSKKTKWYSTYKIFKEADAIFMKGGGLIQSHGGLIASYATYYRLYHIFLAHYLKKQVYILPNSFGPFDGPFVKLFVKNALKKCKFVSSREEESSQYVKDTINLNIPCYPDLAFFLEYEKSSKETLGNKYEIPVQKKWVAITVRPYRFPNNANPKLAYEKYKDSIVNFIKYLILKNYTPILIEHTHAITDHENDGMCINEIKAKLNGYNVYEISDQSLNCRELKDIYSNCDYIVGTRFHSLIFSFSCYVPGIAISYDGNKTTGIMNDIGLSDYVIQIDDISTEKLVNCFQLCISNENLITKKIETYLKSSNKRREKLIKDIMEA